MEELSYNWFMTYYLAMGTLLLTGGIYSLIRISMIKDYLLGAAGDEHPPSLWIQSLKGLFYFTLPCLLFSFFPFSWPELLFSIWCLIIVYMAGQLLAYWPQTSRAILQNREQLRGKIKWVAGNMLSIGIILFLLCYYLITKG